MNPCPPIYKWSPSRVLRTREKDYFYMFRLIYRRRNASNINIYVPRYIPSFHLSNADSPVVAAEFSWLVSLFSVAGTVRDTALKAPMHNFYPVRMHKEGMLPLLERLCRQAYFVGGKFLQNMIRLERA